MADSILGTERSSLLPRLFDERLETQHLLNHLKSTATDSFVEFLHSACRSFGRRWIPCLLDALLLVIPRLAEYKILIIRVGIDRVFEVTDWEEQRCHKRLFRALKVSNHHAAKTYSTTTP